MQRSFHFRYTCPLQSTAYVPEVKAALRTLEQRFAYHVIPTVPQLGVDFASFVAVPAWITAAGKQVIVL